MKSRTKKISRKKGKKISARKKSGRVLKKKRVKKLHKAKLSKRRGKEIYDVVLPAGNKSEQEIDSLLSDVPFKNIRSEDEFIKITFVERKGKEYAAFTRLSEYEFEDRADLMKQVKQDILDMNYTFFRRPASEAKDYWKKMYRLKNYLHKITIDFETAS